MVCGVGLTAQVLLERRFRGSALGLFGIAKGFAASLGVVRSDAGVSKSGVTLPNDLSGPPPFREKWCRKKRCGEGGGGG